MRRDYYVYVHKDRTGQVGQGFDVQVPVRDRKARHGILPACDDGGGKFAGNGTCAGGGGVDVEQFHGPLPMGSGRWPRWTPLSIVAVLG